MDAREKNDRAARKSEFRRAARVAPLKFARKLERLERAENEEKSYYAEFGGIYDALARFREAAHAVCWDGVPAPCAIHLNKGFGTSLDRVTAISCFLRDGDRVVPALSVNLRVCVDQIWRHTLSHRRLAIELLRGMVLLRLSADGREPKPGELAMLMDYFGYNEASNKYRRGTQIEEVLHAADECLADVLPRLRPALYHPFGATSKGDARYYLRT